MAFVDSLKKALAILKLDGGVMQEVALDNTITLHAFLILIIAGIASAIGQLNLAGLILLPIVIILIQFINVGITHGLALLFGGQAKYMQLFRAMSFSSIIGWIQVIPVIGPIIGAVASLWLLVVEVVILKYVHKLTIVKAIIVVLIPIVLIIVLFVVLSIIFIGSIHGFAQLA